MQQPPAPGPREVCAALERMRADAALVAGAVADGVLVDLPEHGLPELTAGLLTLADTVHAAGCVAVGRLHAGGALRSSGFVSTKSWLQAVTGCGAAEAGRVLARARDLDRPELAPTKAAWLAGHIGSGQVREVCVGLSACERKTRGDTVLTGLVFGTGQSALLDLATTPDPRAACPGTAGRRGGNADLVRAAAAAKLLATVFPDGASAAAVDAFHNQHLTCRRVGDEVDVRGMLTPDSDAIVSTALDRIIDTWHREGSLAPTPVIDPVTGLIDREATARLLADAAAGATTGVQATRLNHLRALALVELARAYLDGGKAGTRHHIRPHLVLNVSLADLIRGAGAGTLGVPGAEPAVVPISTIARLGCDADVTLALTQALNTQALAAGSPRPEGDGATAPTLVPAGADLLGPLAARLRDLTREVLWLGREHRHVDARLWRFLTVRDRHCRFPGCHADVSRCHPHHVLPWWLGGETDPANLILLCARHHRLVHDDGWQITPRSGASPLSADYWQINAPPRRTRR